MKEELKLELAKRGYRNGVMVASFKASWRANENIIRIHTWYNGADAFNIGQYISAPGLIQGTTIIRKNSEKEYVMSNKQMIRGDNIDVTAYQDITENRLQACEMVVEAMAKSFEQEWKIFSDVMFELYLQEFMYSKVMYVLYYICVFLFVYINI